MFSLTIYINTPQCIYNTFLSLLLILYPIIHKSPRIFNFKNTIPSSEPLNELFPELYHHHINLISHIRTFPHLYHSKLRIFPPFTPTINISPFIPHLFLPLPLVSITSPPVNNNALIKLNRFNPI
jgi:hypothetical protein